MFHNNCSEIMQQLYQNKKLRFIVCRYFSGLVGTVAIVNTLLLSVHQILSLLFVYKVLKLLAQTLYELTQMLLFSSCLLCKTFHNP